MLDQVVKPRSKEFKKDGPPQVLFLRDILAGLPADVANIIADQVRTVSVYWARLFPLQHPATQSPS